MSILDIYQKYKIMPQLQDHQLAVAAVADFICANFLGKIDRDNVVAACLLHDMGNIIKFDLNVSQKLHPGLFTDEDLVYWQKVKNNFVEQYGLNEHSASLEIAKGLGVSQEVIGLIDSIGFNNATANLETENFNKKICAYSDMRVWPRGVIGLEVRLADLRVRYNNKFLKMGGNEAKRVEFEQGLRNIEQQIFERCGIKPEDITEEAIAGRKEKIKGFEI